MNRWQREGMNWVPTQIDDFEWYEENVTRLFSEEPYF